VCLLEKLLLQRLDGSAKPSPTDPSFVEIASGWHVSDSPCDSDADIRFRASGCKWMPAPVCVAQVLAALSYM
jgi:hypothetical protein